MPITRHEATGKPVITVRPSKIFCFVVGHLLLIVAASAFGIVLQIALFGW